jgi:hypothetical protein
MASSFFALFDDISPHLAGGDVLRHGLHRHEHLHGLLDTLSGPPWLRKPATTGHDLLVGVLAGSLVPGALALVSRMGGRV